MYSALTMVRFGPQALTLAAASRAGTCWADAVEMLPARSAAERPKSFFMVESCGWMEMHVKELYLFYGAASSCIIIYATGRELTA